MINRYFRYIYIPKNALKKKRKNKREYHILKGMDYQKEMKREYLAWKQKQHFLGLFDSSAVNFNPNNKKEHENNISFENGSMRRIHRTANRQEPQWRWQRENEIKRHTIVFGKEAPPKKTDYQPPTKQEYIVYYKT